jgi:hypothetical protein
MLLPIFLGPHTKRKKREKEKIQKIKQLLEENQKDISVRRGY